MVTAEAPPDRIASLDALRGIAAVLVVFAHCYSSLPADIRESLSLYESPLRLLVLGRPSVILFFVLSGVVLSLSLERHSAMPYGAFVARRFFRIYVPFAAAIFGSAVLYGLVDPQPIAGLSDWFNRDIWSVDLSLPLLATHLAMVGRPEDVTLNGPMWSLIVELRLSLVFPLLFAALWSRPALAAAFTLGSFLLMEAIGRGTSLGSEPYFNHSYQEAVLIGFYFVPFFALGILIARHRRAALAFVSGIGPAGRGLLVAAALVLSSTTNDLANGLGAALIIVLVLGPSASAVLAAPVLRWLGRISYSLYLVHVPVLGAVMHTLYGTMPVGWILLVVVAASLASAELGYRFVERPSMALGKRLTAPAPATSPPS